MKELGAFQGDAKQVMSSMAGSAETDQQKKTVQAAGRFTQQGGSVIWRLMWPYLVAVTLLLIGVWVFLISIHGIFIFLLCFVAIIGYGGSFFLAARAWQQKISQLMDFPIVEATDDQLAVGQTFDVHYAHHFKQDTTIELLKIQLVMREWVKYTQGTSTYTDTRSIVISEEWREMVDITAGQTYELQTQFSIPENAMHSWTSPSHNRIHWMLVLDVDLPGWLDYSERFGITVKPEVVSDVQPE